LAFVGSAKPANIRDFLCVPKHQICWLDKIQQLEPGLQRLKQRIQ
jgi:hypothetical protein